MVDARLAYGAWAEARGGELGVITAARHAVVALTAPGAGLSAGSAVQSLPDEAAALHRAVELARSDAHPMFLIDAGFVRRVGSQLLPEAAHDRLPLTRVLTATRDHTPWELSLPAQLPALRTALARDPQRLRALLREAAAHDAGPTAVRLRTRSPSGPGPRTAPGQRRRPAPAQWTPRCARRRVQAARHRGRHGGARPGHAEHRLHGGGSALGHSPRDSA